MDALRFYSWFWLLLAPIAMGALWWRFRPQRRAAAVFSSVSDLKGLPVTNAQRLRRGWLDVGCTEVTVLFAALPSLRLPG